MHTSEKWEHLLSLISSFPNIPEAKEAALELLLSVEMEGRQERPIRTATLSS
jgi:hypothetical protein